MSPELDEVVERQLVPPGLIRALETELFIEVDGCTRTDTRCSRFDESHDDVEETLEPAAMHWSADAASRVGSAAPLPAHSLRRRRDAPAPRGAGREGVYGMWLAPLLTWIYTCVLMTTRV